MLIGVTAALCIPYLVSRFIYKDYFIKFPILQFNKLPSKSIRHILFSAIIVFVLFSVYFSLTHAYKNWPVHKDFSSLFRLFIGILVVGLWDELMFIGTFLMVFKKYFPFKYANIIQATVFSSFLYQMGFRSWGYILIFVIVFLHGATYKKMNSLSYLFIIHTVVDIILYLLLLQYNL